MSKQNTRELMINDRKGHLELRSIEEKGDITDLEPRSIEEKGDITDLEPRSIEEKGDITDAARPTI